MRLLLFSNSTNAGEEYLAYTLPHIEKFVNAEVKNALFLPYAGISLGFDEYHDRVQKAFERIGIHLASIHAEKDKQGAIAKADLIVVGGGNTFCLLKSLHDEGLLTPIRERVLQGVPYIGWSAGSNMACPSIKTTNDMPIVEPDSFSALHLIPFQINPHYTEFKQEGHAGETREMRIGEYLLMNTESYVVGLPEGDWIEVNKDEFILQGSYPCKLFKAGEDVREMVPGSKLVFGDNK